MQNAMTYILFAFWLAVLFAAWRLWKRVVRDMVRDSLFDLRDNWRDHWVMENKDLANPFYGYVRNQINGYLRYTAQWRVLDTWYIVRHIDKIVPVAKEYSARKMPEPAAPDSDASKLAAKIRTDSIQAMRAYMMLTSVLLCPVVAIVFAGVLLKTFAWDHSIRKALDFVGSKIPVGDERMIESAVTIGNFNFA